MKNLDAESVLLYAILRWPEQWIENYIDLTRNVIIKSEKSKKELGDLMKEHWWVIYHSFFEMLTDIENPKYDSLKGIEFLRGGHIESVEEISCTLAHNHFIPFKYWNIDHRILKVTIDGITYYVDPSGARFCNYDIKTIKFYKTSDGRRMVFSAPRPLHAVYKEPPKGHYLFDADSWMYGRLKRLDKAFNVSEGIARKWVAFKYTFTMIHGFFSDIRYNHMMKRLEAFMSFDQSQFHM